MTAAILNKEGKANDNEEKCFRCIWYSGFPDLEDVASCYELGSCDNVRSDHFGHVTTSQHPSCKLLEKEDEK